MARHSSGRTNYRLSRNLTIAVITIVVIIALIIAWALNRSSDSTDSVASETAECIQGDLSLPIGGDSQAISSVVEQFNSSNPHSRDFCITAHEASEDEPAATYLFAGTKDEAAAAFEKTGAVASSSKDAWSEVTAIPAGIASAEDAPAELADVSLPVASNPSASAAVALALAPTEDDAAKELAEDHKTTIEEAAAQPAFATTEGASLPEGYTFTAVADAFVPVWAIATNAGENISEEQARAGADLAAQNFGTGETYNDALSNVLTKAEESAASQAAETSEAPADPEAPAESDNGDPMDTIINLDTSANMDQVVDGTQESYHTVLGRTLVDLARETGALGNQVALNNYSSPLNPGVTKGWRANVSFPDQSSGENAAGAIVRMGTGGIPLTRASVVAAAQIATEGSNASGRPARVVVITSGSEGEYNDEAFLRDLDAAAGDNVTIHMVHVGHGAMDQVLSDWVSSHGGTVNTATTVEAINASARSAFGF